VKPRLEVLVDERLGTGADCLRECWMENECLHESRLQCLRDCDTMSAISREDLREKCGEKEVKNLHDKPRSCLNDSDCKQC
jgi:hypothetical protein